MQDLAGQIENKTNSDAGLNKRLVLFGDADTAAAAKQIADFVETHLGARIVEVLLVAVASAGTFGFRLSDGRSIFLKIHAGISAERLQAAHETQEVLRQRGIPVARSLLEITPFGDNGHLASVHAFRNRGERLRAGQKGCVEGASRGLARLDRAAEDRPVVNLRPVSERWRNALQIRAAGAPEPPKYTVSPRAHDLLQRIDEKVANVPGSPRVSHGDWVSHNLRFWNGEVSSIFDFEALVAGPLPLLVGKSAVMFVNEPSGVRDPADAAVRFVESYETESGHVFSGDEAMALDAGVAYAVAIFLASTVRSGHVKDEEAEDIFKIFMRKFRTRFVRDYKPLV
jgi:Ser/Thr protein kinase RdoA (MazF antagonist)